MEESYVGLEVDQMTLKSSSTFIILCSVEAKEWLGRALSTPLRAGEQYVSQHPMFSLCKHTLRQVFLLPSPPDFQTSGSLFISSVWKFWNGYSS